MVIPSLLSGPHDTPSGRIIRAYLPGAATVEVLRRSDGVQIALLEHGCEPGLFEGFLEDRCPYRFRIQWPDTIQEIEDPYSYALQLGELDLHLFNEGRHFQLAHALGAQAVVIDAVPGVRFAVWAPNASRVAVVGDFNSWDRRRHPMRVRHGAGIWELFIPRVSVGSRYKYDILGTDGIPVPWKADPVARQTETPPSTASVVPEVDAHRWTDGDWMATRSGRQGTEAPIAIYEAHLGSWLDRGQSNKSEPLWDFAIDRLVPYVADMGFTHLELLPITEHPLWRIMGIPAARDVCADGPLRLAARLRALC
jgi:1,4-alpha-glucan branching enzyme